MKLARTIGLFLVLGVCTIAHAQSSPVPVSGRVKKIISNAMPTYVFFMVDGAALNACNSGSENWIHFVPTNADNAKAVYSAVLGAYLSGRPLYMAVDTSVCYAGAAKATQVVSDN